MLKNHKNVLITPMVLALGVMIVLGLSGCQEKTVDLVSKAGVNIEAMLPTDLIVMVKAGTDDRDQHEALKKLNAYFPNDPLNQITNQFVKGFKEGSKMEEEGINFEENVLPIVGDNSELYFALFPKADATDLKDPQVFLAMTLADLGKFDNLANLQVEKGRLKKSEYNGVVIYKQLPEAEKSGYLARINDVAVVVFDEKIIKKIIDNVNNKQDPLQENKVFQRAIAKVPCGLGFAYIDMAKIMDYITVTDQNGQNQKLADLLKASGVDTTMTDSLESEVFALSAEEDGIRLQAVLFGKEGTDLGKDKFDRSVYLFKKIPAKNPVAYIEAAGLKTSIETIVKSLSTQQDFEANYNSFKEGLKSQGLDWDLDIMTFLDKGYALVLDDNNTFIPNLGLYIDASSNPIGAKKVAVKLDQMIGSVLLLASSSPEMQGLITKEELIVGSLWKVKVDMEKVLASASPEIAEKLKNQKLELYYGLNADNILVVVFQSDWDKSWAKSLNVGSAPEFKKAKNYLRKPDQGLSFFSPAQLMNLADLYVNEAKQAGSVQDTTEYELVKSYLLPIKSVIFSSNMEGKNEVKGEAFIHIGK